MGDILRDFEADNFLIREESLRQFLEVQMWKNDKEKTELIFIDSQLRQIKDAMELAKGEENTIRFSGLILKQLELSRRKNELIRELTQRIDFKPDQNNVKTQESERVETRESEEVEPNQILMSVAGFLFSDEMREAVLGCIEERFHDNCAALGKTTAQLYLLCDIFESAYPVLKEAISKQIKTNQIGFINKGLKIVNISFVVQGIAMSFIVKTSYKDSIIVLFILFLTSSLTVILLAKIISLIYNLNNSMRK